MKKCFKKAISGILTASMLFSSVAFVPTSTSVVAAATTGSFSTVGGWNESLYAEWADQNPDNTAVKVGYKLSGDANYTYLTGDDYTYLIRPVNASLGRVDIPGLKAGTYDLEVTSSDGTVYTQTGIQVTANDRSGYAFWNRSDGAGVGAYNDDGTPKDNAIIVYVTDENKDKVEVPGYEGKTWSYTPSTSAPYTRTGVGIGNILNNNMKLVQEVTITDNHPIIFRFVGKVNVPQNLTPGGTKDPILGGGIDDNGNLAITKYGRNITIEGIGSDATIEGWGFTFSQTSTCPTEAGKNFEVRNLTFENYPEDGLAFQGDDGLTSPIQRVWVHNNTFYPGHADKDYSSDGDKKEGDGSCDFKRGQYYTMSYNHFVKCHKTNLLGSGGSDAQYYITLHHNWYEQVGSRQPLMASGNIHIYNTYFQGATDTTVDCRYNNVTLLENNYYDNCKNYFKSRTKTCYAKSYGEIINGGSIGSVTGTRTVATSRTQSALASSYTFPDGTSMKDFDISTANFYYDAANKKSDVQVLNATADVPAYVKAHAGVLSVGTASEDVTETTTSSKSDTATETTTTGTVTPSTGDSVKDFNDGSVSDGYYKFTGSKKNIASATKTYNGKNYTKALKMESGTEIKFTPKNKGKLTLVTSAASKRININGTAYTTDANGVVEIDVAAATEYTITKGDTMNLFYLAVAEEASAEDTTEATTNQPTVAPTEATTAKATEATTEATTAKATEATTKEATSETTTESTPAPTPSTGLAAGSYSLISFSAVDGIDISAVKEAKGSGIKVADATQYLAVTPAVNGTIQITWSNNAPVVKANNEDVTVTVSGSIATFAVTAGTTYKLYTSKTGSNCTMTNLVLAESATPADTTTEATTVATTEATTAKATEATTKEATTEATTVAPTPEPTPSGDYVVAGTYSLNDTTLANAKTGTYNNITYSVSSVEADHVRIKNTDSIKFKVAEAMNLTITFTQADVSLNGTVIAKENSPYTVALTPNTEYTLAGATSSNARVSTLTFANGSVAPTETTTVATTEPTTVTTTVTTTEATTETTTVTTTEATTVKATEATTKEATSETTTETTPAPSPVTGVNIVADSVNTKVGTQVTIPVRVTGLTSLASLDVNVAYDSSKVTVNSVSNGDVVTDSNAALSYNVANGTVGVAIANPAETVANGDVLFNLVVTPTAEGTATFTITVDEAYAAENQTIEATTTAGTLTIAKADPVGPTIVKGDADKNGLVEKNDVTTILNYVAGLISSTEIDTEAADVNGDSKVTTRDAYIIQKYLNTGSWN